MLKPQRSTRHLIATTLLLASSFLFSASAQAVHNGGTNHDEFITTWNMGNNDTLTFPGEGGYTINWGDPSSGTDNIQTITGATSTTHPTHEYASDGIYTVTASNTIDRFNLNNGEDKEKLTDVSQWGTANWTTMFRAFHGATALTTITATDTPNLPAILQEMFNGATNFNNSNIGNWDTSNVTTMFGMFYGASTFNQDIGDWNTSRVTNINSMFQTASAFNQDISRWNISKVNISQAAMFIGATNFSQNLGAWYIVASPLSSAGTITLTAQSPELRGRPTTYTLATVTGEANNNNLFTLTGSTLTLKNPNQAAGL